MPRRLPRVLAVLLLGGLLAGPGVAHIFAQSDADQAAVTAVIQRSNTAQTLPYDQRDPASFAEYLLDPELTRQRDEIDQARGAGVESTNELLSFEVTGVTFPAADRAMATTNETWRISIRRSGETLNCEGTANEQYALRNVDGRWAIEQMTLLGGTPTCQSAGTSQPAADSTPS